MADATYKTFQIWIKDSHRLFPYFEQMCLDAKHLYNTTNFYIRQVYTSFRQDKPLQPLVRSEHSVASCVSSKAMG